MADGAELDITTLGGLTIRYRGVPLTGLASRKAEALLLYLVCAAQPTARDTLVELLWDELPAERGRGNLSVLLTSLRQQLDGYIVANRQTVAFDHARPHRLDSAAIERAWRAFQTDPQQAAGLERALALEQGDFLAGFGLRDAAGFEAWALQEQERVRRLIVEAREALVAVAEQRRDLPGAIGQARALLRLDPLREDVHRTLIRLLLASGQRGAALAQFELCRRMLEQELGVLPAPETSALRQRILSGSLTELRTEPRPAPPSNVRASRRPAAPLPTQPTPFVGRTTELAQITKRLGDADCRLLTLLGPGGIGKTRLALQAAALHGPTRPDGVVFVPLAALTTTAELVAAVVAALGLSFLGQSDPAAHLLGFLAERDLLLLLDNFEQIVDGAELVSAALAAAPRLTLLVTSRERLRLRAEWLFELEGLSYPAAPLVVAELARYSAVQLFVQQASRVQPRFALDAASAPPVRQICQLVEGLPLAIELAAAWAHTLEAAAIAAAISGTLDALATDLRDVPERHRSVRAVFLHSWRRLDADAQTLLASLAVFRGGWDRPASAAVCGADAAALAALTERSLLRWDGARYALHELLRQFAAEQLAAIPALERATQQRHAAYFLELIAQQTTALGGDAPQAALALVRTDLPNMNAALHHAAAIGELTLVAGALDGLARYHELSGLAQAGAETFGALTELLEPHGAAAHALRARAQTEHGRFLSQLGAYDQALAALAAAADQAVAAGDGATLALARTLWGDTLGCQGRYAEARQQLALALAAPVTVATEIDALGALGTIEEEQGQYAAAQAAYGQTLVLSQALGDQQRASLALQRLGVVAEEQGRYGAALEAYHQALAIHRARGNRASEGAVLNNLGVVHRDQSDYDAARAVLHQALEIAQELSNQRLIAVIHVNLADTARDLGDYQAAIEHYQRALAIRTRLGNQHGVSQNLADLGLILHQVGDDEAARDYSQRALEQAQALEAQSIAAFALTHLGHALLGLEQPEEAATAYQQALAIRTELGQPVRALDALAGLTRVMLTFGQTQGALAHAEVLLRHIQAGPLHGAEEPARIVLSCYQALRSAQDPRAAPLLRQAVSELKARAAGLQDPAERRAFLEQVAAHQALIHRLQR